MLVTFVVATMIMGASACAVAAGIWLMFGPSSEKFGALVILAVLAASAWVFWMCCWEAAKRIVGG